MMLRLLATVLLGLAMAGPTFAAPAGTPLPIPADLRCPKSYPDRDTLKAPCVDPRYGRINVPRIHFDFDKATLRPESRATLDALAALLKRVPVGQLEVQRHHDNHGRPTYGRRPSRDRARAVAQYLIHRGVEPTRLVPRGYGASQPVALDSTPEGRQQNRRMAFVVLRWGPPDCSEVCDTHGTCLYLDGQCRAVSALDCRRSARCSEHGHCLLQQSACINAAISPAQPAP